MTNDNETVREVCAEMMDGDKGCYFPFTENEIDVTPKIAHLLKVISKRIIAAHERDVAAKDVEIDQLVTKCNRLERALKPVMECDVPSVEHIPSIGEPKIIRDFKYAQNAVREARRIMKESKRGESHN